VVFFGFGGCDVPGVVNRYVAEFFLFWSMPLLSVRFEGLILCEVVMLWCGVAGTFFLSVRRASSGLGKGKGGLIEVPRTWCCWINGWLGGWGISLEMVV